MNASAKTMLRGTEPTRHRCEFASSADSKSKRRKRAQAQQKHPVSVTVHFRDRRRP